MTLISWFFNALVEQKNQVIQSDLFGMVKTWPFQGVKSWPPTIGDEKGTLNHQEEFVSFILERNNQIAEFFFC